MATTTPNFGWSVPTSSDLVKNGATAIETLGDSIDASLVDLKGGTTGQVLAKATNTDMDFTWTTPSGGGGGAVVQVVSATYSTTSASSSSTFADTGLTATITPTSASNKILVFVNQNGCGKVTNNTSIGLRLVRASTTISNIGVIEADTNSGATNRIGSMTTAYLDSPATTSATTYKTQFNSASNLGTVVLQESSGGTFAMSTIVLMEVTP
jgi:hypothetical protein